MKRTRDPRANKVRDDARHRSKTKDAQSASKKIKAHANRVARRNLHLDDWENETVVAHALRQKTKPKAYENSSNAAERRNRRRDEELFLRRTSGDGPTGRSRAVERRREWDTRYYGPAYLRGLDL